VPNSLPSHVLYYYFFSSTPSFSWLIFFFTPSLFLSSPTPSFYYYYYYYSSHSAPATHTNYRGSSSGSHLHDSVPKLVHEDALVPESVHLRPQHILLPTVHVGMTRVPPRPRTPTSQSLPSDVSEPRRWECSRMSVVTRLRAIRATLHWLAWRAFRMYGLHPCNGKQSAVPHSQAKSGTVRHSQAPSGAVRRVMTRVLGF